MSEIRKNDEHWRDNLVGMSYNKNLERSIHKRHMLETLPVKMEMQKQSIDELLKRQAQKKKVDLLKLLPNIYESAVVAAVNPKNKKILDIGFNTPEDLILDNFGKWLAAIIQTPTAWFANTSFATVTLKDTANTDRAVPTYANAVSSYMAAFNSMASSTTTLTGTKLQVGSGTTAAARSNYTIQTAFGSAPENTRFPTGPGSYASGYVVVSGSVAAGGSGTVNETGFFGTWNYGTPGTSSGYGVADFMLFHDILGSGVAFAAGNLLMTSYSINL
jgi:hypothetical protein